jgi:hypothetical protein
MLYNYPPRGIHVAEEKLSEFLKNGKDWSRFKTSVSGVFVQKLPAYRNAPTRLAVEINPVNDTGQLTRRRGLLLHSRDDLDAFNEAFQYDKIANLIAIVESVNPAQTKPKSPTGEDVIEI